MIPRNDIIEIIINIKYKFMYKMTQALEIGKPPGT